MQCPKCNAYGLACSDSRPYNETIRRRRRCLNCGYRFTTVEISVEDYHKLKGKEADADGVLSNLEEILTRVRELRGKSEVDEDGNDPI